MALPMKPEKSSQFDIGRGGQMNKACNHVPLIPSGATLTADKDLMQKLRSKLRYRGVKPLIPKRHEKSPAEEHQSLTFTKADGY